MPVLSKQFPDCCEDVVKDVNAKPAVKNLSRWPRIQKNGVPDFAKQFPDRVAKLIKDKNTKTTTQKKHP